MIVDFLPNSSTAQDCRGTFYEWLGTAWYWLGQALSPGRDPRDTGTPHSSRPFDVAQETVAT